MPKNTLKKLRNIDKEGMRSLKMSAAQQSMVRVKTLSMESSLMEESYKHEKRQKQSISSKELRGGITKMGGFRRPSSTSFYQVKKKKQLVHRPVRHMFKKVNADLVIGTNNRDIGNDDSLHQQVVEQIITQQSLSKHRMNKSVSTEFIPHTEEGG